MTNRKNNKRTVVLRAFRRMGQTAAPPRATKDRFFRLPAMVARAGVALRNEASTKFAIKRHGTLSQRQPNSSRKFASGTCRAARAVAGQGRDYRPLANRPTNWLCWEQPVFSKMALKLLAGGVDTDAASGRMGAQAAAAIELERQGRLGARQSIELCQIGLARRTPACRRV